MDHQAPKLNRPIEEQLTINFDKAAKDLELKKEKDSILAQYKVRETDKDNVYKDTDGIWKFKSIDGNENISVANWYFDTAQKEREDDIFTNAGGFGRKKK